MDSIITLIIISAALALALNVVLRRFQVESVIGYILTGMAVGYAFDLQHSPSLGVIAEFGIVFLMFTIGLEFSPEKLRLMKREVFVYGLLQVGITAGLFMMLGHWLLGLSLPVNLIVSLSLSLSSTAIVLNLLTKSRKVGRRYGRNAVGVLLFQDIAVIPILLMVSLLASEEQSLAGLLLDVGIDGTIIFVLLFLGGRVLTPHVMAQVLGARSNELFVMAVLLFVVGAAQIAHGLGFTYSLGAFLAGMVLSETQYKHQVEADLTPFRDLLLGVFFISVGMQVDPELVLLKLPLVLGVMVLLLAVKGLVLFALMRFFHGTRTTLKTTLLLAQCGEFSFVIFEAAQSKGLFMDPQLAQILVMAIVLTMMLTPFVFRYLDTITQKLTREPDGEPDAGQLDGKEAGPRVLVLGYGALGQRVGAALEAEGIPVLGVEHDGASFRASRERGLPVCYGNAASRQLLEALHVDQAPAVVVAMSNESRTLLVVESVRQLAPEVPIRVCASNSDLKEQLRRIQVAQPVDTLEQSAAALTRQVLETLEAEGSRGPEQASDRTRTPQQMAYSGESRGPL